MSPKRWCFPSSWCSAAAPSSQAQVRIERALLHSKVKNSKPSTSESVQALRGLAKIALERNDRVAAKAQYERILGKALMGRGPPAEHWAHSEYAWLVFEDGDLEVR